MRGGNKRKEAEVGENLYLIGRREKNRNTMGNQRGMGYKGRHINGDWKLRGCQGLGGDQNVLNILMEQLGQEALTKCELDGECWEKNGVITIEGVNQSVEDKSKSGREIQHVGESEEQSAL